MAASPLEIRARRHAALGDPVRLAIVDSLASSDRSPVELRRLTGIESNLLAHHLDVLEQAGLIGRSRSSGDGRRRDVLEQAGLIGRSRSSGDGRCRYVHLDRRALNLLGPRAALPSGGALFVCTRNSARSQLAAALWRSVTSGPAESAGTHPAERIDARALAAARRAKLPLVDVAPRSIAEVAAMPQLVVTVCDQAHEELDPPDGWLHWSIPDPVLLGTAAAFDATIDGLRERVVALGGESSHR